MRIYTHFLLTAKNTIDLKANHLESVSVESTLRSAE